MSTRGKKGTQSGRTARSKTSYQDKIRKLIEKESYENRRKFKQKEEPIPEGVKEATVKGKTQTGGIKKIQISGKHWNKDIT